MNCKNQRRTRSSLRHSTLNFHDLFKAQAIDLRLPCQLSRPDTYGAAAGGRAPARRLQDKATTAWNFHTALYYKAGGVPWRLARQPAVLTTCYVGVSFFKSVTGDKLMTSVAQVFDERGEGLIVQGGSASYDKDDRSPHLSKEDAQALLANGLATYRREHHTMPARLVMHKTSYFNEEEKAGFRQAAEHEKLNVLDLVSVRRSGLAGVACRHFTDGSRHDDAVRWPVGNRVPEGRGSVFPGLSRRLHPASA